MRRNFQEAVQGHAFLTASFRISLHSSLHSYSTNVNRLKNKIEGSHSYSNWLLSSAKYSTAYTHFENKIILRMLHAKIT